MLEWVDRFNNRRLLEPIGNIPPAEFRAMYGRSQEGSATAVGLDKRRSRKPGAVQTMMPA